MANIGGASMAKLLVFAIGKRVIVALIEGVLYLAFSWDLLSAFLLFNLTTRVSSTFWERGLRGSGDGYSCLHTYG